MIDITRLSKLHAATEPVGEYDWERAIDTAWPAVAAELTRLRREQADGNASGETMIDVNGLNALHAAATQGDWQRCQAGDGQCPCGLVWDANEEIQITVCSPQPLADAMWITESHNAWLAVEARLAMLEEFARRVRSGIELADAATRDSWTTAAVNWIDSQTKKAGE